jgi:hypothetical protein
LLAVYPSVPLFETQGLGVALLSYHGRLHWGFLADPSAVPDLEELVYVVAVSFCELLERASEARAGEPLRRMNARRRPARITRKNLPLLISRNLAYGTRASELATEERVNVRPPSSS